MAKRYYAPPPEPSKRRTDNRARREHLREKLGTAGLRALDDSYHKRCAKVNADKHDTPEMRRLVFMLSPKQLRERHGVNDRGLAELRKRACTNIPLPPDTPNENWRWAPGLQDKVAVSDMGNVLVSKLYSREPSPDGAPLVVPALHCIGGKDPTNGRYWAIHVGKNMMVHHLVLLTFVGPRPTRYHYACHYDDNPLNNQLSNLRWDSPRNNILDRQRNQGPTCGLTFEQVREVYVINGESARSIATRYGLVPQTATPTEVASAMMIVANIRARRTYAEVTKGMQRGVGTKSGPDFIMPAEDVAFARRAVAGGSSILSISRLLGFSKTCVLFAVRGRTWAHMQDPPPVPGRRMRDICQVPVADPSASEKGTPYPFAMVAEGS